MHIVSMLLFLTSSRLKRHRPSHNPSVSPLLSPQSPHRSPNNLPCLLLPHNKHHPKPPTLLNNPFPRLHHMLPPPPSILVIQIVSPVPSLVPKANTHRSTNSMSFRTTRTTRDRLNSLSLSRNLITNDRFVLNYARNVLTPFRDKVRVKARTSDIFLISRLDWFAWKARKMMITQSVILSRLISSKTDTWCIILNSSIRTIKMVAILCITTTSSNRYVAYYSSSCLMNGYLYVIATLFYLNSQIEIRMHRIKVGNKWLLIEKLRLCVRFFFLIIIPSISIKVRICTILFQTLFYFSSLLYV